MYNITLYLRRKFNIKMYVDCRYMYVHEYIYVYIYFTVYMSLHIAQNLLTKYSNIHLFSFYK